MTRLSPSEISVTLPSNSNLSIFKTNKPNSYKTVMKRTINEDNAQWEVAPISITYPHTFDNWERDIKVGLMVVVPYLLGEQYKTVENDETKRAQAISEQYLSAFCKDRPNKEVFLTDAALAYWKSRFLGTRKQPIFIDLFTIPKGYYTNVQEFLDQIESGFEKRLGTYLRAEFGEKYACKFRFKYDPSSRRVFMKAEGMQAFLFTEDREFFVDILGLPSNAVCGRTKFPFYGMELPIADRNPCTFLNIHSIYVYSDIINYQLVGDTEAPLFGTVPILGNRDQIITYVFNPTYYYPVSRANISEIEIQLNTENGDPFPFTQTSKVVLRLHFRKKPSQNLASILDI